MIIKDYSLIFNCVTVHLLFMVVNNCLVYTPASSSLSADFMCCSCAECNIFICMGFYFFFTHTRTHTVTYLVKWTLSEQKTAQLKSHWTSKNTRGHLPLTLLNTHTHTHTHNLFDLLPICLMKELMSYWQLLGIWSCWGVCALNVLTNRHKHTQTHAHTHPHTHTHTEVSNTASKAKW